MYWQNIWQRIPMCTGFKTFYLFAVTSLLPGRTFVMYEPGLTLPAWYSLYDKSNLNQGNTESRENLMECIELQPWAGMSSWNIPGFLSPCPLSDVTPSRSSVLLNPVRLQVSYHMYCYAADAGQRLMVSHWCGMLGAALIGSICYWNSTADLASDMSGIRARPVSLKTLNAFHCLSSFTMHTVIRVHGSVVECGATSPKLLHLLLWQWR